MNSDTLIARGRLTKSNSLDLPVEWKDIIDPDSVTVQSYTNSHFTRFNCL